VAHEVFISYASVDSVIANTVCATLESNKIACWIAPRNILPGKDFAAEIIDGIESSRVFVLILSTHSAASPHVLRELNKAASRGIPILSFFIEEVSLSKSMEYYLSTDHWLDATSPPLAKHIHNLAVIAEKLLIELNNRNTAVPEPPANNKVYSSMHNINPQAKENTSPTAKVNINHAPVSIPQVVGKKTDPDKDMLIVDCLGSGTYRRINEAIDASQPNQKIFIKTGTYKEQLILTGKSIQLIGEGMDKVKLSYDSGSVLEVNDAAGSEISGISFTRTGYKGGNAVCHIKSSVTLKDCRVYGGEIGILITGGSPIIHTNQIERGLTGIVVDENASPFISENNCSNSNCGIMFISESRGKAVRNECKNNVTGIIVSDSACPVLEENDCSSNKTTGITYQKNSAGKAIKNICGKNINGILVCEHGQPSLESNECSGNREAGILYNGHTGGCATGNISTRNRTHGIQVSFKAQPTLEGNQCTRNKLMGIAFFDLSTGLANNNTCNNNDLHGILVRDRAQPDLEYNNCNENREAGIAYFDYAQGVAKENMCRGNRLKDIIINGQATPILISRN